MRVLHVIKGLGPGGAERLLVSLSSARSSDVVMDVAYTLPHKSHLVDELRSTGTHVHLLAGRRGLADPRWPVRLRSVILRTRPDVVHVHSPAVAAAAALIVRTTPNRPALVTTEHNLWQSFGLVSRAANGITIPLADARLAVSEEVRASVWSSRRGTIEVLVQGIPVAELQARRTGRGTARELLGLTPSDVLVMTVANFREKKDYPTLLAAAAACVDDPRLKFAAIGQGPLEHELRSLHAELGLGDRFRFLGYHPDPPAVVAAGDVFALSSLHEGLPIAMLEAMALGVAPVATAVGGIPEVVTHDVDGVLVPPGDAGALAVALRALADDPDRRRQLGDAAARRAADFDIAHARVAHEALYRKLLEQR